jgi:polar amino acid transport system substrate-binding protein
MVLLAFTMVDVGAGSAATWATTPSLKQCTTIVRGELYAKGHVTVATDNPVYAPWFVNNTPANGQGYESALAYLVAKEFDFTTKNLKWVTEPFADSYQPGTKSFDFDVNEVTYSAAWAKNVTFSSTYYNVQQSLVAMKSDSIVKRHTAKELKNYHYGALAGSPALTYATTKIIPKFPVVAYKTLSAAELALINGSIDAIVIDTPTGNHIVQWDLVSASDAQLAVQVGQFPANGDEYYALVMQKKNPLATCVNVALSTLHRNGSIAKLTKSWLAIYTTVPKLTP